MSPAAQEFDPTGPLPTGLVLLEASAGTGKTYALCTLAVRYIAEADVRAGNLCLVTFTEAATAELRGRVRERLVEAAEHLERGAPETDDPVLRVLADPATADGRAQRLRDAIAELDLATISTIHGLCARVLAGVSAAASEVELTDGGDVDEVVTDLLLARSRLVREAEIDPQRFTELVRMRLAMPDAVVFPSCAELDAKTTRYKKPKQSVIAAKLVEKAAKLVRQRQAAARRRTFTDLLTDARDALQGDRGREVVAALRERYRVVLVDEFQDTDRVQWDIFRRAFVEEDPKLGEPATVVLVGDPKQSIYRFRSADLAAYFDARGAARSISSLTTNRRSDRPLLTALEELLGNVTFGKLDGETVGYQPVEAAPGHDKRRLHGAGEALGAGEASLVLRCVPPPPKSSLTAARARRAVRNDVVAVAQTLLDGDVQVEDGSLPGGRRPLAPRDIAVLTRTNAEAALTAATLSACGIPAATSSATSVLDTDAALQWAVLLRALERPGDPGLARAAALGWFCGMDPGELVSDDEQGLGDLHDLLHDWAGVLASRGVPHLLARARANGLVKRLLSRTSGERDITDLDHIAELLQSATGGRPATASTLLTVLRDLKASADGLGAREVLARRIDRDDDAVQVLTIHRAKGLEFPVVLCPYLWTQPGAQGPLHAHCKGTRRLDGSWVVNAGSQRWNEELRQLAAGEQRAEALRQVYVALTRARHLLVVWWAHTGQSSAGGARQEGKGTSRRDSPLGDVLACALGRNEPPQHPDDLKPLHGRADGALAVVEGVARGADRAAGTTPSHGAEPLTVATAQCQLDASWRIWSFSALTAAAEHTRASQLLDDATARPIVGGFDEPVVPPAVDGGPPPEPTLLANAPAGAAFGTLVHRVLERCDFSSPTLETDLERWCADELRYQPLTIEAGHLAKGLAAALRAPLGGPLDGLRLCDLARGDRLDELSFDLPLGRLRAHQIGEVLAEHLPAGDPFRPWADGLAKQGFDLEVAGTLTGSIDLAARTPDGARFFVADYKTNQLGVDCGYTRDELVAAMTHAHYPLQAALYLVALHRYLRWRLAGYDPARHVVGAAYLFLRGMRPVPEAKEPRQVLAEEEPRGVLWWTPPHSAIEALDQLLARGASP